MKDRAYYETHPWDRGEDESILRVYDTADSSVTTAAEFDTLIEAPNWSKDGAALYFNRHGRMVRFDLCSGESKEIDSGFADNCNNDHVLAPDGREIAISHGIREDGQSRVYVMPVSGGVPRLLIPDNCKTATTANTRYETVLNRSYQELAEHYGTAIVPARVRKPDDKAAAEGSVRFVSTWITAALRDRKFFSLVEAQQAVQEKLEELNRRPFKKRPGCRLTAYEQEEKAFMRPLPVHAYEPAVWLHPKVGYDYLVSDGVNKYSVPYDLIGEKVDVRLTGQIVEVFYKQTRVAAHIRQDKPQREPIVKPEHMPEAHRRYLNYNAEDFTAWANTVGPNTAETVQFFLTSGKEAEQGFKACASLTKLGSRYGAKRLEEACERVLRLTSTPTIRNISTLCKASAERKEEAPQEVRKEGSHGITRGAAYYRKGGQRNE